MKKFLIILLFIGPFAHANSLLKCLGAEEAHYASLKYTGPNYKLNHMMIDKMSSLSELEILPSVYKRICSNPAAYPSLVLLEELTDSKSKIFKYNPEQLFQMTTFKELKQRSGEFLIRYLSDIQATAKTPKCLETRIPGIKQMFARYRYLQEELSSEDLTGSKEENSKIFEKLYKIDSILKDCQREAQAKRRVE